MKNMKIDVNGTEIRVMCDVANEEVQIPAHLTTHSAKN